MPNLKICTNFKELVPFVVDTFFIAIVNHSKLVKTSPTFRHFVSLFPLLLFVIAVTYFSFSFFLFFFFKSEMFTIMLQPPPVLGKPELYFNILSNSHKFHTALCFL